LTFTRYDTVYYGVAGIGLHLCKMERSGDGQPTLVLDWQDNITSDALYAEFRAIADRVYKIT
jgi:hypothetical protein